MAMTQTFDIEHNRLFSELKATLQEDIVKIAGKCNGGKSILFVYPPSDEEAYIAKAHEVLTDGFEFIDVRKSFVQFLTDVGMDNFEEFYKEYHEEVFFSQNFEDGTFFAALIGQIKAVFELGKVPVLVHTGALYGMNFSNINIMEHRLVIDSRIPLVVFYPATIEGNQIMFLGKRPASKYRCIVIK